MSKKITLIVVVLIVVILIAVVSLLVPQEESKQEEQERKLAREFTTPASALPSTKDSKFSIYPLAITAKGFDPREVVVRRGDFAQFDITNMTGTSVDIKADAIGLYIPSVQPNEKTAVSLEASKNAEIEVVCYKLCPEGVKLLGRFIIQE